MPPEYKKYNLHVVQVMGANIELWQYKTYENGILNIEEIYKRTASTSNQDSKELAGRDPVIVEAGKKAILTRKSTTYSIEEHFENLDDNILELFNAVRDFIVTIDSSIEETPKKNHITYKTSQNFGWNTKNRIPYLDTKELRLKVWNHIRENAKKKGIFC